MTKAGSKKPLMPTVFQSSLPVKMKMPPSTSTSTSKTKVGNEEDVQTILTLKKDAKNEDHFEIDLDTIIDPHTGKPMKVHAVADVDKDTMEVHGMAEAKDGQGMANIKGAITHAGHHDEDQSNHFKALSWPAKKFVCKNTTCVKNTNLFLTLFAVIFHSNFM